MGSLVNLWDQVRTLRGLLLVSRTGDDTPCVFSKMPPCVHSKRHRVCRQHAHMLWSMCACWMAYTGTIWMYTRRRFESTHGFFSVPHTPHTDTPRPEPQPQRHTTHHRPHHRHHMHSHTQDKTRQDNTQDTTSHTTSHGDRDRERQRKKTETEKRQDKTRQEERQYKKTRQETRRRQEKRRQDKTRQETREDKRRRKTRQEEDKTREENGREETRWWKKMERRWKRRWKRKRKWKRRWKTRSRDQEKMKRDRDEKRWREKRWKNFFLKNVWEPSNPPDELAQHVSKKSLSDELFLICPSKVQNLAVFSINYMIRIRFFRAAGICTEGFRTHGTSITLVLLMTAILLSNQVWLQEGVRKKEYERYSSPPRTRRWTLMTWQNHDRYLVERSGKCTRMQFIGSIWKVLKTKD